MVFRFWACLFVLCFDCKEELFQTEIALKVKHIENQINYLHFVAKKSAKFYAFPISIMDNNNVYLNLRARLFYNFNSSLAEGWLV